MAAIQEWMNMESRVCGFTRELAESMHERLLEVICKIVLGTEKNHASLGY